MSHRLTHRWLVAALLLASAPAALAAEPVNDDSDKANLQAEPAADLPRKPLDLRPPDIATLLSPAELQAILSRTLDENIEEIEVQRERTKAPNLGSPDVPLGILSPFWALAHPLQAWRIFAPIPPDRAQYLGAPADATDSYRPVSLPQ